MEHSENCFCSECLWGATNTLYADWNFEVGVEFFRCEDVKSIGLTIEDRQTGKTLDVFLDKAALVAALSK
jgi:hypothetical protein